MYGYRLQVLWFLCSFRHVRPDPPISVDSVVIPSGLGFRDSSLKHNAQPALMHTPKPVSVLLCMQISVILLWMTAIFAMIVMLDSSDNVGDDDNGDDDDEHNQAVDITVFPCPKVQ